MITPRIAILLPCFNEALTLKSSLDTICNYAKNLINEGLIKNNSFIAIVDDGSADESWELISQYSKTATDIEIKALSFSRNFGHQNALFAGLLEYSGETDAIITMDIDLQDDYLVIHDMIDQFLKNKCEIVYGIRGERKTDSFFKRNSAQIYYGFLKMMKIDIFYNHADFRLTSKKVNLELFGIQEAELFLRGIFPFLGFKSGVVYYDRKERELGKTKYSFGKMLKLAWVGIISFSSYPLDLIFKFALVSLIFCILLFAYVIYSHISGLSVPGWSSITLPIIFYGTIQLLSLGVISKYISRIFVEVKKRPRFIIREKI